MSHRVLIVGLGRIGMEYDLGLSDEFVLTHARAFSRHPAFDLIGGVDPNPTQRERFEHSYQRPAYGSLAQAFAREAPEILVLAVPTAFHEEVLCEVFSAGTPKVVLLEKPLATTMEAGRRMTAACQEHGAQLFVNYQLRCESAPIEVKRRLTAGKLGFPIKGVVWYAKGLFNNGSHFLNLLQDWLGPVTESQVLSPGEQRNDVDPEPDVRITFGCHVVYFLAAREKDFSYGAIELIGSEGRLRYEGVNREIEWQEVQQDPVFSGYRILKSKAERIGSDAKRTLWNVANELANALDGRAAFLCNGNTAIETIAVLCEIRRFLDANYHQYQ